MIVSNISLVRRILVITIAKMQKLKSFIWKFFCDIGAARYDAYKRNPRAYWY